MLRRVCTASFLVMMVGQSSAQPSSAQAEVLFRQAKQLMSAKKFAEACAAFDASQKLDPTISTVMNQADCREKNGQLATAWGLFLDAVRQTRSATDPSSVKLRKVAAQRAAKLEPRLSKLTIAVDDGARLDTLAVERNGEVVDPGAWNRSLPVNGGTYTLTAKAEGHEPWTMTITIAAAGDVQSVDIPRLPKVPPAAVVDPRRAEPATMATVAAPASGRSSERSRIVPISLTVGALALLGGAAAFELSSRGTYDEAQREPDDATQESLWDSSNRKRYLAVGFATAGIACAGLAVWLFVRSDAGDESSVVARGVSVAPVFAADGGGFVLDARF